LPLFSSVLKGRVHMSEDLIRHWPRTEAAMVHLVEGGIDGLGTCCGACTPDTALSPLLRSRVRAATGVIATVVGESSGAQGPTPMMWCASRGDPRREGGSTTRSCQSLRPSERMGRSSPPPRRGLHRVAGMCSGWCARRGVYIDNPAARGR
jgi:hypothetical protein